jgi:DNA-binding transcriptional ArsR family regulator
MIKVDADEAVVSETAALTAAACLFHGFSDRSRLAIVQHLVSGEHRVTDLVRHLGLAQSTVSQHLACLVDCGIAQVRPQGRASVYSLAHPGATLELLSGAEKMLALTGDAVTLCRTYGVETTPSASRTATRLASGSAVEEDAS